MTSENLPHEVPLAVKQLFLNIETALTYHEVLKIKEAERVKLGKFPHSGTMRSWRAEMISSVLHASGRPDNIVVQWLALAENKDVADDDLQYLPIQLMALDRKLSSALIAICDGEFYVDLMKRSDNCLLNEQRSLMATYILRRIYRHLGTSQSLKTFHNIQDFQHVKWQGNEKLMLFKK